MIAQGMPDAIAASRDFEWVRCAGWSGGPERLLLLKPSTTWGKSLGKAGRAGVPGCDSRPGYPFVVAPGSHAPRKEGLRLLPVNVRCFSCCGKVTPRRTT